MIEKLAVIALIFLNQLNVLSEGHNSFSFLEWSVKKSPIQSVFDLRNENWLHSVSSFNLENVLKPLPHRIGGVSDFNVNAKSALVLDAGTNTVLYSKNSDKELPIASLTKIMTALVILEKVDLNDTVVVSEKAVSVEGRKNGIVAGEKIRAGDLLKMMLIESNNIAAVSLAEYSAGGIQEFVELMNKKAEILGLKNTIFYSPTGLDREGENNHSTAYEVAQLVNYALEKPLIWDILKIQNSNLSSIDGKTKHRIKNTNLLLGKMENVIGGKTGFTDEAGECLTLVVEDPPKKHKIISVVLNADDRFLETEKLVEWTFDSYRW
jgi:D-alanyl-D-alanine carboxypeptidase (penicillin-binding protein 5/6)